MIIFDAPSLYTGLPCGAATFETLGGSLQPLCSGLLTNILFTGLRTKLHETPGHQQPLCHRNPGSPQVLPGPEDTSPSSPSEAPVPSSLDAFSSRTRFLGAGLPNRPPKSPLPAWNAPNAAAATATPAGRKRGLCGAALLVYQRVRNERASTPQVETGGVDTPAGLVSQVEATDGVHHVSATLASVMLEPEGRGWEATQTIPIVSLVVMIPPPPSQRQTRTSENAHQTHTISTTIACPPAACSRSATLSCLINCLHDSGRPGHRWEAIQIDSSFSC